MKILTFPDERLLTPCEEVVSFDTELLDTLDSMWKIMKESHGIGLAANQVGIKLDMFVMDTPNGRMNFINPYISATSVERANMKEGCLSAPRESLIVPGRSKWVQVVYENEKGEHKSVVLHGIYAVCAQHEIEHLDGKSFMEHKSLLKTTRKALAKKWGLKK
jgi:peptide deformylase